MPDNFPALYRTCKPGTLPWSSATAEPELVRLVIDGTLKVGQRAIDIGCGQGTEAVFLAAQGLRVAGVDAEPRAIQMARALARHFGVRAEFKRANALSLPFAKSRFDAALDRGLFHHLDFADYEPYAAEVHRVLKRHGLFFLRCFSPRVPGTWGPRRIRAETIPAVFATRFEILDFGLYDSLGAAGPPVKLWKCLMRKR